jgi:hypothetical protein
MIDAYMLRHDTTTLVSNKIWYKSLCKWRLLFPRTWTVEAPLANQANFLHPVNNRPAS